MLPTFPASKWTFIPVYKRESENGHNSNHCSVVNKASLQTKLNVIVTTAKNQHTLSLFMSPPDTLTTVGRPSSRATTAECESRLHGACVTDKEREGQGPKQSWLPASLAGWANVYDLQQFMYQGISRLAYLPLSITSPEQSG